MKPTAVDPSRLAKALGVELKDLPAIRTLFVEIMDRIGVNGAAIFQRLAQGMSLAEALQVPAAAIPVLYARAHNYFSIGRTDKALLIFRALCALSGENADHWAGFGVCQKNLGQIAEAESAFGQAARRRPGWALPYFHLTDLAIKRKDWPKARAALEQFNSRVGNDTPDQLIEEAKRFEAAIVLHEDPGRAEDVERS